jgi:hypothetical protein
MKSADYPRGDEPVVEPPLTPGFAFTAICPQEHRQVIGVGVRFSRKIARIVP